MTAQHPAAPTPVRVLRAGVFGFGPDVELADRIVWPDGVIVIRAGRIVWCGPADQAEPQWLAQAEHYPGCWLTPGFIDLHMHFPQFDVIASPADGLLPWLSEWTFPAEAAFADPQHAHALAPLFTQELLRHGVTSALVFGSSHVASVDALLEHAQHLGMRLVAGKVLMDQNAPDGVRDQTEQSLRDTEALLQRWQDVDRLGVAITPRFVPSCSAAQLQGAAELAAAWPSAWVQSHVAENTDEIAWVRDLYPGARSYLDVYDQLGLLRPRAIYAHGIWLDATDRDRLAATGAAIAVCPTSNLFLGSGLFDFEAARQHGMPWGLASDVSGGSSYSPFRTMLAAFEVARLRGVTLSPWELWFHHTRAAALIMGWSQTAALGVGCEADLVLIDPQATPLLARRSALARSFEDWLFSLIVLGDDRHVRQVWVNGEPVTAV